MNQTLTGSTVADTAANVGGRNTEAAVPKQLGLVNKLCQIMAAVGYVQKTGYNKFHGYKYATEADLVDMIRGELAQRNIFVFPDVKEYTRIPIEVETMKGTRKTQISEIKVAWTFVDGDTGQERTVHVHGVGEDNMDKGFYKAFTGSEKYLLMKSFLIPTGDDPEADSKADSKAVQGKANGAGVEAETVESPKEPPNVYLEPGKQGFCTITGDGLAVMLSKLYETEKTILGLAYDGNFWTVPIANAFRFADACVKHGVGVVHMDSQTQQAKPAIPSAMQHEILKSANTLLKKVTTDSGAARTSAPNGRVHPEPVHREGGAQPSPASPSKIIKGTFLRSGTFGPKHPRKGQKWELLQVIWGDSRYVAWNRDWWPLLEAGKGKPAVLSVVEPVEKGKDGTITGILRIGDTEYEQIEEKTVPILQREAVGS